MTTRYCYETSFTNNFFMNKEDAISEIFANVSKEDAMSIFFEEFNKEEIFNFIFNKESSGLDLEYMKNHLAEIICDEHLFKYSLSDIEEQIEYETRCLENTNSNFFKECQKKKIARLLEEKKQLTK